MWKLDGGCARRAPCVCAVRWCLCAWPGGGTRGIQRAYAHKCEIVMRRALCDANDLFICAVLGAEACRCCGLLWAMTFLRTRR